MTGPFALGHQNHFQPVEQEKYKKGEYRWTPDDVVRQVGFVASGDPEQNQWIDLDKTALMGAMSGLAGTLAAAASIIAITLF